MERRNFLKRLFNIGAASAVASVAASIPALAKADKETFTLDDIAMRCTGNKDLFYIRQDCWLNQELANAMGERVVDRKYFSYYDPKRDILIPVKDEYTKEDFMGLILWAKSLYTFNYYCNGTGNGGVETGLCRFILDHRHGMYHVDFFAARNPKNN